MRTVLIVCLLGLYSSDAIAQWPPNTTINWYVDSSVGSINFDPGSANVQSVIESFMPSLLNAWISPLGLKLSTTQGYGYPRIKIQAGDLSHIPGIPLAITDPIPTCAMDVSIAEIVITLNSSSQIIFRDAIDPVYNRDLGQETAPYANIDIRTVLLHELAHAFGMDGSGPVGVLHCVYHGSNRFVDAEVGAFMWNRYEPCHGLTNGFKWQRVRTSFDDGNPNNTKNGRLWSNMWFPRRTAGSMQQKRSGWTVSWKDVTYPTVPTVEAEPYQVIDGTKWKFRQWQKSDDPDDLGDIYDYAVIIEAYKETAIAHYAEAFDFTLTEGEYCDGSPATCSFIIEQTPASAPYTGDIAPAFEDPVFVELIQDPGSTDIFLYWYDNYGNKIPNRNLNLSVTRETTFTPVFQRHMTSNHAVSDQVSESGTSTNNQRKIAFVDGTQGTHHQVYESCGMVYYTRSTDQGLSWAPETPLSDLLRHDADKPSIHADTDSVWVVFCQGDELVLLKFSQDNTTPGLQPYDLSALPIPPRPDCTPVITRIQTGNHSCPLLIYEAESGVIKWVLFNNGFQHSHGDVVANLWDVGMQVSPSIVRTGFNHFNLVWRDGTDVYYRPGRISTTPTDVVLEWVADEETVPFGGRPAVGAPTISSPTLSWYGGQYFSAIACETGSSTPTGISLTFHQGGSMWWHVQTFIIANEEGRLWAPSISFIDATAIWTGFEHFRLAYNYTDNFVSGVPATKQVWAMQPEFDQYGNLIDYPIETRDPALHPGVVDQPPAGGNLSVFTSLTGQVSNDIEHGHQLVLNKTQQIDWQRSRELSIRRDTTLVTFGIANLRSVTASSEHGIAWERSVDSSIVGIDITVEDEFRTKSFPVFSGTRLKYTVMDSKNGYNTMPSQVVLGLELREAWTDQLLGTLGTLLPNSLQNGRRASDVNLNLSAYAGQTVYLQLALSGLDSTLHLHAHDIWSANTISSANAPKLSEETDSDAGMRMIAADITLSNNYPNPFTSSTTLEFNIPETATVRLEVYNSLGVRVATIVDGEIPAGRHTRHFDATVLPAGLYSCRLIVSGQLRTQTMILSR